MKSSHSGSRVVNKISIPNWMDIYGGSHEYALNICHE